MSLQRLAGHTSLAILLPLLVRAHEGKTGDFTEHGTSGSGFQNQPAPLVRPASLQPASLQQPWSLLQRSLASDRAGAAAASLAPLGAEAPQPLSAGAVLAAVNGLLAGRGFSPVNPEEDSRAASIVSVINGTLLPAVLKTHAEDQGEIYASRAAIGKVEEMAAVSFKYVANLDAVVGSHRQRHKECRATKLEACDAADAACNALDSVGSGGCGEPPDKKNRTAMIEYADRMVKYWSEVNRSLSDGRAHCERAVENCTAQGNTCSDLQQSFELGFCTWREKLQTVCAWYTHSLSQVLTAYRQREKAVRESEAARWEEYRALKMLLCYVDLWWGNKDVAVVGCANVSVDLTAVTIDYPDIPESPGSPVCAGANSTEYPCSQAFLKKEYFGLVGMLPEDCAKCTSCPEPETPSPTPSPTQAPGQPVPTPAPPYGTPPPPTSAPIPAPTPAPTQYPTASPSPSPTPEPSSAPTTSVAGGQTTTGPTATSTTLSPLPPLPPPTSTARPPTPAPSVEAAAFAGSSFWFSAGELSVVDGGSVDMLPDKSGHGNNASALPDGRARYVASAVAGRPAVHFPATPPWRCYDTPPLPSGTLGQVTIAAVLQWETQLDWATVAEFQHGQQYAVKRHGGKELCGLQTKGLCAGYFMGEKEEALSTPYVYTARYDGSEWQACLQRIDNASAPEACSRALGPGGINASGVLRIGGSEPGSGYCNLEAMSGWLSEFVVWNWAKSEQELQVIKETLLRQPAPTPAPAPLPPASTPSTGSAPPPGPSPEPSPAPEPEPALELAPKVALAPEKSVPVPAAKPVYDEEDAFAGAEFWFDAAELRAADGDVVGSLPDKSGSANNATQVEDFSAARFAASAVHGRPAVHFPATPPWKCYETPRLPGGNKGQITIAAVLQWEERHDWATVAEFRHDQMYALKRHGGKELCGLQTKGLCSSYFMGKKTEELGKPYVYTAHYNGTDWRACLQEMGSKSADEVCVGGRGPTAIEGSGVLRIGGSSPGASYCTDEAMSGWLSEFIVWPRAKAEEELRVIKATLLGKRA